MTGIEATLARVAREHDGHFCICGAMVGDSEAHLAAEQVAALREQVETLTAGAAFHDGQHTYCHRTAAEPKETPMSETPIPDEKRMDEERRGWIAGPNARMDGYYIGFERTGNELVDQILSAVAIAGKGAHRTDDWIEGLTFDYGPVVRGGTFNDLIRDEVDLWLREEAGFNRG